MNLNPARWQSRDAGIALMLIGILLFSLNDVLAKWLVATYTVPQLIFLRSVGAFIMLAPFIHRNGWRATFRLDRPALHALRWVLIVVDLFAFVWAVQFLPVADVLAIYLAAPLIITALSGPLLGEKIGWRRWSAVFVGFIGVLLILRPGDGVVSVPALVALLGTLAWAGLILNTRALRGTPDLTLISWHSLTTLVSGGVPLAWAWVPPSAFGWVALVALGVLATFAHMSMNRALKLAPASLVAPFQYTMIVWAALFGWLVFGDVPSVQMLIGTLLVVGSGLYVWHRERVRAKAP
jgi:drug/metabolite transporter (DMT)-like permease